MVAVLAMSACGGGNDTAQRVRKVATTVSTAAAAPTTAAAGAASPTTAVEEAPTVAPPTAVAPSVAALPAAKPVAGTTTVQFVDIASLPLAATATGECTTASAIARCQVATGVSGSRAYDGVVFDYCFLPFGSVGRATVRCVVPATLEAVDVSFVESATLGPVPVAAGDVVRLQLASGVVCAITAREWSDLPASQRVSYTCADGSQVVGPLDEAATPKWTAALARNGALAPVGVDVIWRL